MEWQLGPAHVANVNQQIHHVARKLLGDQLSIRDAVDGVQRQGRTGTASGLKEAYPVQVELGHPNNGLVQTLEHWLSASLAYS